MIRVHIIEDEANLLDDLIFGLRQEGFEVSGAPDGRDLEDRLGQQLFDVLVLDLMLPYEDGLSIGRRLNDKHPEIGIVMLTGRSSVPDRIVGLESGADIYLSKTVERRELVAAIRAVSRRVSSIKTAKKIWLLEREGMKLKCPNESEVLLTRQEFLIMLVFSQCYGGEASRKKLIEGLGFNYLDFDQRRLETLVSRLRRKIEDASGKKGIIRALRAEGYLFTEAIQER